MRLLRDIRIGLVAVHPDWQHRVGENAEHTRDLVDAYQAGAILPPLDVVELDDGTFALVDGYHRLAAKRALGEERVDLRVMAKGSAADAVWWACSANRTHGLRRSAEEKRKAVAAALAHVNAGDLSNKDIAAHCGVSQDLVASMRSRPKEATAKAVEVVRAAPDASQRAVAREAGVSRHAAARAQAVVKRESESGHLPDTGPWERLTAAMTQFVRQHAGDLEAVGESNAQLIRSSLERARHALTATMPVACPKHTVAECPTCGGRGWVGSGQARAMKGGPT